MIFDIAFKGRACFARLFLFAVAGAMVVLASELEFSGEIQLSLD
jgi:hypothetical protein